MTAGIVRAGQEAVIQLTLRGPTGREQSVGAVIDTGFTGFVTLPSSVIDVLGLTRVAQSRAVLADGSDVEFDVYEAVALWDDRWLAVDVSSMEADALVGMRLLAGYRLCLDGVVGGRVTIEALP